MQLQEYIQEIRLTPYPHETVTASPKERDGICSELLRFLIKERGMIGAFNYNYERKRKLVNEYMTERDPHPVPPALLALQDKLLWSETLERGIVDVETFHYKENVTIFRGDITKLNADAIVNSTGSSLVGCRIAGHQCIDNIIHLRAGMQMRMDGFRICGLQGRPESTGDAKITCAYNLPCKYVIHTVGPAAAMGVTEESRQELRSSYMSCMYLAKEMGLKTIAFNCISTGILGFPHGEAAEIAVGSVKRWQLSNPDYNLKVIFDVYSDEDIRIYSEIFKFM